MSGTGATSGAKTFCYEVPPSADGAAASETDPRKIGPYFPRHLLIRQALWFCRLRWIVIAIFVAFGLLGLSPTVFAYSGLRAGAGWPFATAVLLASGNAAFLIHARRLGARSGARGVYLNQWGQIVFDLLILTFVLHVAGVLETYFSFAYLFHIVLACIFFPPRRSLIVTALACGLYAAASGLAWADVLPPAEIYGNAPRLLAGPTVRAVATAASAPAIWFVVWYLASHLSAIAREREREVVATNRRLGAAQKEKTRHMLRTTHELKAPFAAIHANTQLLLRGYCGALPEDAREIVARMAERCRRLAAEIQEMLQLANLNAAGDDAPAPVELDLARALRGSKTQLEPLARERGIALAFDLEPARVFAVEDHVKMVFTNLLSNAILYSREGERVRVTCRADAAEGPVVTMEDRGLGIPADKLPLIFDEYYRTDEAVRFNRESTGLGLAIVRRVVQAHGIAVRVESRPGVGTTFELRFPPAPEGAGRGATSRGERRNGVCVDSRR